jgi:hypothetical protein
MKKMHLTEAKGGERGFISQEIIELYDIKKNQKEKLKVQSDLD